MKPDAYMPFYFRAFFEAIKGQPPATGLGYLSAICYYWGHTGCRGILNTNDEFLRRICEIERDDWDASKDFIFDNDQAFALDSNGLWHQKKAAEIWAETKLEYDKAVERGKLGAVARWGRKYNKKA